MKNPEVADAAVKIQKVYRGFQTRKELHSPSLKVDERDRKRGIYIICSKNDFLKRCLFFKIANIFFLFSGPPTRKKVIPLESTVEERGELLRHPGDVVAAAITLQRFFRYIN